MNSTKLIIALIALFWVVAVLAGCTYNISVDSSITNYGAGDVTKDTDVTTNHSPQTRTDPNFEIPIVP